MILKTENTTVVAPLIERVLGEYTAPGWLVFFGGTIIALAVIMAIACYKFSKCSVWTLQTCGNCCKCCNSCLLASNQNCTDCTEGYKSCFANTYECVTFGPRYVRARRTQVYRVSEVINMPPVRRLPVERYGFPDPMAQG